MESTEIPVLAPRPTDTVHLVPSIRNPSVGFFECRAFRAARSLVPHDSLHWSQQTVASSIEQQQPGGSMAPGQGLFNMGNFSYTKVRY